MTVSGVTATELGHLSGLTGNIQSQINTLANKTPTYLMSREGTHNFSFSWGGSGTNTTLIFYVDNTKVVELRGFRLFNGDASIA